MFEVSEDECGFDDVADSPGAGGDALEGAAAFREKGGASFPRRCRARRSAFRVRVPGAAAGRLSDRGENVGRHSRNRPTWEDRPCLRAVDPSWVSRRAGCSVPAT